MATQLTINYTIDDENAENTSESLFSGLSPAQLERLIIVSEECSEVIHIISKIIRHGFESSNPYDLFDTPNKKLLEKEIGDLEAVIDMLIDYNDISFEEIDEQRRIKKDKFEKDMLESKFNRKHLHHN